MTRTRTATSKPSKRTLIIGSLSILSIALALVLASKITGPRASRTQTPAATLAVNSGNLPGPIATPPNPIPDKLPIFSLADLAGKPTLVSTWAGKSLVLNFWATWCAPCRQEMPLLAVLHQDWAQRNVQVIGIAYDEPEAVKSYAKKYKIPYPVLVGEQDALDVMASLGVQTPAFPFTVFTDNRGEVVALFMGELHRVQADLILAEVALLNTVTTVKAGNLQLNAARKAIAAGLDRKHSS